MAFARYLIRYSYIGTGLKGAQNTDPNCLTETVQGNLELALRIFKTYKHGSAVLSSRTDKGVHALNTSTHFDFFPYNNLSYPPERDIAIAVNRELLKKNQRIIINELQRVPETFHARYCAKSRTYLYRIAVVSDEVVYNETKAPICLPVEELHRIFLIRNKCFDVDMLRESLKLFEGLHDFGSFKKTIPGTAWRPSIRHIISTNVTKGLPMITSYTANKTTPFKFWDIEIKGRSFVHNQIRRMVGAGVAVALNKVDISEIKLLLTVPSKYSWNNKISVLPPHALYLCDVEYDDDALKYENPEAIAVNE